jgi:aryl-alcohol dehydrogenase-like predicted oxidoreductase
LVKPSSGTEPGSSIGAELSALTQAGAHVTIARRPLGRTGADVSILGYGAMELRGTRGWPDITDAEASRLLNAVLDGGINLIDTSIDYGRSEELIGRHLAGRRDEYFLASKCGCPPPHLWARLRPRLTLRRPHDYRPANVRAGVEGSLRRLRTDRLDLVQVHMSPSRAQLEADGTVATLTTLRDQGKVRFIGMSGTLPHLADHIAMGTFDVLQIPYSALQRDHEDLITAAAAAGAGTVIRGGVARGGPAKGWSAEPFDQAPGEGRRQWQAAGLADLLDGMSPQEFLLRFTLSHPGLSSTIVGTARLEHLQSNLATTARGPLPADLYDEARQRLTLSAARRASSRT